MRRFILVSFIAIVFLSAASKNSVAVTPTPIPSEFPSQTPTQTELTTITPVISPATTPEDLDQTADSSDSALIISPTATPPIEDKTNYDLKEIAGIGLVIFLVMVIIFQNRSGVKKEPPVTV